MESAKNTATKESLSPEQREALYVLANTKGVDQRMRALAATGLDGVPMQPLVDAGVITVTKNGQLRIRPEGRLVAAGRLSPERQEIFNDVLAGSFVGSTAPKTPEESIEARSRQISERELARRAALFTEKTKEDWIKSIIRKAKPKRSDDYGTVKKKLNTLEAVPLRQRAAFSDGLRDDFYDMYERLRVLMLLRKRGLKAKTSDDKAEIEAQVNAVFELVKNPSDDEIRRQRERERRVRESDILGESRSSRERIERKVGLGREDEKERIRKMSAHDRAMYKAQEIINRFEFQKRMFERGDRKKPPAPQMIKGDRGALGILSDERDRLSRATAEPDVRKKIGEVDKKTHYAMSLVNLAPAPGERIVPLQEIGLSALEPAESMPDSARAVSRPMTHRQYGKYILVRGIPKYEISNEELRRAKSGLEEALSITDSDIQDNKFRSLQKGPLGKIYGADPFVQLRDSRKYRVLWDEMRGLLEKKRSQGGGSLTSEREKRLKEVEAQLARLRSDSVSVRTKIESRAHREKAKATYDEIVRELDDRKRVLFENAYRDVASQRVPRIRAAREYLDKISDRMDSIVPGVGPKLKEKFSKLKNSFLLAMDAAGQPDVKSKRESLNFLLGLTLKEKAKAAEGLAKAKEELANRTKNIEGAPMPEAVREQLKAPLLADIREYEALLAATEQREESLKRQIDMLSLDSMARTTDRELLIAGLPDAGAQTGLTSVGSDMLAALADKRDVLEVADNLLSQQAKPDYLRGISQFATAMVKSGKGPASEFGVKKELESRRGEERIQDAQRRSNVAALEDQLSKIKEKILVTSDAEKRQSLRTYSEQISDQILKLRTGETLPSQLMMETMRAFEGERKVFYQMKKLELKKTIDRINNLLDGNEIKYQRVSGESDVETVKAKRVPEEELEAEKLLAAQKAGIGSEVESLIESGEASNADNAIDILEGEIRAVRIFSSKYQDQATKVVKRFEELQSKVNASSDYIERFIELSGRLEEVNAQIKKSEKEFKRADKSGLSPAQRAQLISDLKEQRNNLSEEISGIPAPLQRKLSPLFKAKTPGFLAKPSREDLLMAGVRGLEGRGGKPGDKTLESARAPVVLELSEYEEYKSLKPQYDKIIARAEISAEGVKEYALLLPDQRPMEEVVEEYRKTRFSETSKGGERSLVVGMYPLVSESKIEDYRRLVSQSPRFRSHINYSRELGYLIRKRDQISSYLREYGSTVSIDNVEYTLKIFKPGRLSLAQYVSPGYGDYDFEKLAPLAKKQANDRAQVLTELLSSQTLFNRTARKAVKRYKGLALSMREKEHFKRDLRIANPVIAEGGEPTPEALSAKSRLIARFNGIDEDVFSLPDSSEISNIDTRLAMSLAEIKQAILAMASAGLDLSLDEILSTEGRLEQYNDIVKKSGVTDPKKSRLSLSVLSMIDSSFEDVKARASQIIETKTIDNGEGEDGTQRVSVSTFIEKDESFQRASAYEERIRTKGMNILTPQESTTLIRAEFTQDRQIKRAAKQIEAKRESERKRREQFEKSRSRMGLEPGERLHVFPSEFGSKSKRVYTPGSLHSLIPVLKNKAGFRDRYRGHSVTKKDIAFSRGEGQNAIREMIALAAQIYRNAPPPPDKFELAVEIGKGKPGVVAVYVPSQEAEDYLYKPSPKGWSPTGIIAQQEEKIRKFDEAQKKKVPFKFWDRHAEAYIKMAMTESPRAPIIRRITQKDSIEEKVDRALDRKASMEALESVRLEASKIPVMSESKFDEEFPTSSFERISIPSSSRAVTSKIDPDRIVRHVYSPMQRGGKIVRLVAPINVSAERADRPRLAQYYAVQLREMFTEEVLSDQEKIKGLMYPHLADESAREGAPIRPLSRPDLMWPRLAQFVVVNHRDKTTGLYTVFPKNVEITSKPEIDQIINMLMTNKALADYEITRARVAARWVSDLSNQPNKWSPVILSALHRREKNPGAAAKTFDPEKYIFVSFSPLLGKGIRSGIVKEFRAPGQSERLSGHSGLRAMIRRGLDCDFFGVPKSEVSSKYIRYNRPYDLYFDGEIIFVNTPDEKVSSFIRLSPSGTLQPKAPGDVPRSEEITRRAREVLRNLKMNPSSLEEHVRKEQSEMRVKMSPPEIADLNKRFDRYKKNHDGRTLRALVNKVQEAKRNPDRRVSKTAHEILRELRKK